MADLGAWVTEGYSIPGENSEDEANMHETRRDEDDFLQ